MFIRQVFRLPTHFQKQLRSQFSSSRFNSTIYALSSGINSAISIVRISGPQAYQAFDLLQPTSSLQESSREDALSRHRVKAREMSLRSIYGRECGLIDRCLMVYFPAKQSYSGEDMIELHLHGSRAVVLAVFRELARLKFTAAKRGEFTKRAVLNKRMSLQEAEAVRDLIQSNLQFQRQVAVNNLLGRSKSFLEETRKGLLTALTTIEAFIEFEQQDVGGGLQQQTIQQINKVLCQLKHVLKSSQQLLSIRAGVKISIVGRPNVGKSTLINGLMRRQVAIVSPIAGTTRDLIESQLQVDGFRVKIVDTAGMRSSECLIEQQGIRRTKLSIDQSNFVLVLLDISTVSHKLKGDHLILEPHKDQYPFLQMQNRILIVNKADTLPTCLQNKHICIKRNNSSISPDLVVSLKDPTAIEAILSKLGAYLKEKFHLCSDSSSEIFFTRTRYLEGLERCCGQLSASLEVKYADLVSACLRNALKELQQMIGRVDSQDVLDEVFSSFCIGK